MEVLNSVSLKHFGFYAIECNFSFQVERTLTGILWTPPMVIPPTGDIMMSTQVMLT